MLRVFCLGKMLSGNRFSLGAIRKNRTRNKLPARFVFRISPMALPS